MEWPIIYVFLVFVCWIFGCSQWVCVDPNNRSCSHCLEWYKNFTHSHWINLEQFDESAKDESSKSSLNLLKLVVVSEFPSWIYWIMSLTSHLIKRDYKTVFCRFFFEKKGIISLVLLLLVLISGGRQHKKNINI